MSARGQAGVRVRTGEPRFLAHLWRGCLGRREPVRAIRTGRLGATAAVLQISEFFFALLAAFLFFALVFDHFFVRHLVILAAGEHGTAAAVARRFRITALALPGV